MTNMTQSTFRTRIADLASRDVGMRREARRALLEIGTPAVEPLLEALPRRAGEARPEIFKVLRSIADPAAVDVFLRALEDEDAEVRWIAAEGLVALGRVGLVRLLEELTEYPETEWKLRGAHHVLSAHLRSPRFNQIVGPVLRAFTSDVYRIELPRAALEALNLLRA